MKTVATLATDKGRADVAIDLTNAGYEIVGILPDGTEERPAIAPQSTYEAAISAIHQSYCTGGWDLQWVED
jgi:hypothetical protein